MSHRSILVALSLGLVCLLPGTGFADYDDPDPGNPRPGHLRFESAAQSAAEGAGSFVVVVNRIGGTDGAVSVSWVTSAGSAKPGSDYQGGSGTLQWATGSSGPQTFQVSILDDLVDEADETINVALSAPQGGADLVDPSSATLTIVDDDEGSTPQPGKLGFVDTKMNAHEGGSPMTVGVRRQGGTAGAVSVSYATQDGSAQAGSDYVAVSGTLSWNDGQGGARELTIDLLDDDVQEGDETINLALSQPTGGASLETSAATVTVEDDDGPGDPDLPDSCTPDASTLCLESGDRFLVKVDFTRPGGSPEPAPVVDFGSSNSGLFYFFDAGNIEMLVKVLNACGLPGFDNYWVFYAATTSVEFTLTVVDTEAGRAKTYHNDQGQAAKPVLDTAAFATCP